MVTTGDFSNIESRDLSQSKNWTVPNFFRVETHIDRTICHNPENKSDNEVSVWKGDALLRKRREAKRARSITDQESAQLL